MPELPEVETIKRELIEQILDKEIVNVKVYLERAFLNQLALKVKGRVTNISRIGKYLRMDIEGNCSLIIHLRMTGKLIYHDALSGFDDRHVRVVFNFSSADCLIFHDVRTFGLIEVVPFQTPIESIKKIGVDALSQEFTVAFLSQICSSKATPIKNLLLDQTLIAGIGNIYAQEVLFMAKVAPDRAANKLSKTEIKLIHRYTIEILNLAIIHNGTSISDFRRVDDKTGEFQNFLKVYGKKICPVCSNELTKIKQAGRTTTYCEKCQK